MKTTLKSRPDALLLIAGEGPAATSLRKRTHELGLEAHVRFLGYLDRRSELPACYAAANAFVFASRTETQGLVLLEAMAAGLPVVALSVMGTSDVLVSGMGCMVPPDDPLAFGSDLAKVLGNHSLRLQLAEEAHHQAEEWSDQAMAKRLADLYRHLTLPTNETPWKVLTKARPA